MTLRDDESYASREELRRDLLADEDFRQAYAESFLNTFVAAQIKALREMRGMTQADLAEAIGTKQAGVSRLENVNYSAWKTETLRKIAHALKVRLRISFETFGTLLDEVWRFNRESLQRESPESDALLQHPQLVSAGTQLGLPWHICSGKVGQPFRLISDPSPKLVVEQRFGGRSLSRKAFLFQAHDASPYQPVWAEERVG